MKRIGILGFGTVGSGTVDILLKHREVIEQRLGSELMVKAICSPSIFRRNTSYLPPETLLTTDPEAVVNDPEIDIVIEAIGGIEPARSLIVKAMRNCKSVVTANKLLLARHGQELASLARQCGVGLGIEASVAGGIPVLTAIRDGLSGESFTHIYGVLNGTTNYIITEMAATGRAYAEVLAEAQQLGYAEADPSMDVEGLDARDKLAILCQICFGIELDIEAIPVEGITRIDSCDLSYASDLGYTIRLICSASICDNGLSASVRPSLVALDTPFARLIGAMNGVFLRGRAGDFNYLQGRGAGAGPTGNAVVADVIRLARGDRHSPFNFVHTRKIDSLSTPPPSRWMLRFNVRDRSGIVAKLGEILAANSIGIDAILQSKRYTLRENLPFVVTLNEAHTEAVERSIAEISRQDFLVGAPVAYPIVEI